MYWTSGDLVTTANSSRAAKTNSLLSGMSAVALLLESIEVKFLGFKETAYCQKNDERMTE